MISKQEGEYALALYVATCRAAGCHNEGLPIKLWADATEPDIGCGACGANGIDWELADSE